MPGHQRSVKGAWILQESEVQSHEWAPFDGVARDFSRLGYT